MKSLFCLSPMSFKSCVFRSNVPSWGVNAIPVVLSVHWRHSIGLCNILSNTPQKERNPRKRRGTPTFVYIIIMLFNWCYFMNIWFQLCQGFLMVFLVFLWCTDASTKFGKNNHSQLFSCLLFYILLLANVEHFSGKKHFYDRFGDRSLTDFLWKNTWFLWS